MSCRSTEPTIRPARDWVLRLVALGLALIGVQAVPAAAGAPVRVAAPHASPTVTLVQGFNLKLGDKTLKIGPTPKNPGLSQPNKRGPKPPLRLPKPPKGGIRIDKKPGLPGSSRGTPPKGAVCLGGSAHGTACVCPRGTRRITLGRLKYRCVPDKIKPPVVEPPLICTGGRSKGRTCVCPRGKKQIRLSRNVYACVGGKPPEDTRPPPPRYECRGGKLNHNSCICPKRTRLIRISRTISACVAIPDKTPDPVPPIVCSGGKVVGKSCVCPRGDRRLRISSRIYRCIDPSPPPPPPGEVTPPDVICRGGTARGNLCLCPPGDRRVRISRRAYACVHIPQPPGPIVIPPPGGETKPPPATLPPKDITCAGGEVRGRACICANGARAMRLSATSYFCQPPRDAGNRPPATVRPPVTPPVAPPVLTDIPERVPDEVLVSVPLTTPQAVDDEIAAQFGLTLLERRTVSLIDLRIMRYQVPAGTAVETVLAALNADPRVSEPQPNYVYHKQSGPQTAVSGLQYALAKLGAEEAHALGRGEGAVVAVIDSGIDRNHGDLAGSVRDEFDAVAADPRWKISPELKDSHGTAVAGIISAHGVSSGIAPSARLLNVRAFAKGIAGDTPMATTMRILAGIDWALSQRARILNMSFVGPKDGYVARAISVAISRGAMIVAAAGNNGPRAAPAYPAAYPEVIAVTATDATDALYDRANQGAYVTIAAPGVDVLAPAIGGSHGFQSGTSFAAAYVSGVLALLVAREPYLKLADARAALVAAVEDLGPPGADPMFGAGRVNALAALRNRIDAGSRKVRVGGRR